METTDGGGKVEHRKYWKGAWVPSDGGGAPGGGDQGGAKGTTDQGGSKDLEPRATLQV